MKNQLMPDKPMLNDTDILLPSEKEFSRRARVALGGFACVTLALACSFTPAHAAPIDKMETADRIVAIVDDEPISQYELSQRMKLVRALGNIKVSKKILREKMLKRLVDERLQGQEAKRLKIKVSKKQLMATIQNMLKNVRQTLPQVKAKLAKKGVRFKAFEEQVISTISWNSVVRRRFSSKVSVDQAEVALKHKNLKKDPRRQRKLVVLRQVVLPLQRGGFAGAARSRQLEAMQLYRGFKGCRSLKKQAANIFNVQISPPRSLPLEALDPRLRKALRKMGPGHMTPPGLSRAGVQMIAYCSNKIIKAPEITLKQVENQLMGQQYNRLAERHLRDLRRDAVVEYRN